MVDSVIRMNVFSIVILLGVIQGLFLSVFFFSRSFRKKPSNLYMGFLMFCLACIILEIFLNYSGYMGEVAWMNNFSEPLSFAIGPLMYFYIYAEIYRHKPRYQLLHFIPFVFWLGYSVFYYVQPLEFKLFSYYDYQFPQMDIARPVQHVSSDPLGLRKIINELVMIQLGAYILASFVEVFKVARKQHVSFFARRIKLVSWLRNFLFLLLLALICLVAVKFMFIRDIGDYLIAAYISVLIYATSYNVIMASDFFREGTSELIFGKRKYEKSTLSEQDKDEILEKITAFLEKDGHYKNNLISLPLISKNLSLPVYQLSQVINERLQIGFFELIAQYRIKEAQSILSDPSRNYITIEEIAEEVGYNSKSAFNRIFKKLTGNTPSAYRDQHNKD